MVIACITSVRRSLAGDLFAGSELLPVQMVGPDGAHSAYTHTANKKKFTVFGGGRGNTWREYQTLGLISKYIQVIDFYKRILHAYGKTLFNDVEKSPENHMAFRRRTCRCTPLQLAVVVEGGTLALNAVPVHALAPAAAVICRATRLRACYIRSC